MAAFATASPADAAIDPSAAFSLAFIIGPPVREGLKASHRAVNASVPPCGGRFFIIKALNAGCKTPEALKLDRGLREICIIQNDVCGLPAQFQGKALHGV